jgi:hypothetical protein
MALSGESSGGGLGSFGIGLIGQGISSLIGAFGAGRRRRDAANLRRAQQRKIARLEASRQEIINPYSGIKDLSAMLSNPYANLQVATSAAEMQAQETDISLSSTLDVLRATGLGAGGATALARAAARGKQEIAADIERQEAQNMKLRAQGEAALQEARMQEAQRIQAAKVSGEAFVYGQREAREMAALERAQSVLEQAQAAEAGAISAQQASFGGIAGAAAGLGAMALSGSFKKPEEPVKPLDLSGLATAGLQSFNVPITVSSYSIPRDTSGN